MTENTANKKVAILGGGMGALSAAYQLSEKGGYDITVYQLGWRLGGQGASGRNLNLADRIEEHGLHVWFGFYENAFRVMQRCYVELGRPSSAPLSTIEKAFRPVDSLTMIEDHDGVIARERGHVVGEVFLRPTESVHQEQTRTRPGHLDCQPHPVARRDAHPPMVA